MTTDIRIALGTEIRLTRKKFHRLLIGIPQAGLKLPSKDPTWTNGEVLYRMSISPWIIKSILKGNIDENSHYGSIPNLVTSARIQKTNELFIRSRARNSTRWIISQEYDETYMIVLEMLDGIANDGFDQTLLIADDDPLLSGSVTVEQLFHYSQNHFDTYSQQLNLGK